MWTPLNLGDKTENFVQKLPAKGMVLDLGSGRGRFPFTLAENGFRVIGLEYVTAIVEKNNEEVKNKGLDDKLRFVEGDVLDIPFSDDGFDAVVDIGLLHHLSPTDWPTYRDEVTRVLKKDGYFFLTVLSRDTTSYLLWHPKNDTMGDFENDGMLYHFFTEEEIRVLFGDQFEIVELITEALATDKNIFYSRVLFKKK